jgi:hypothetical protein
MEQLDGRDRDELNTAWSFDPTPLANAPLGYLTVVLTDQ